MQKIIYKDYRELSIAAAQQIVNIISEKPDALLCFPAGETSLGTFEELVRLHKKGEVNFRRCKIVGLDEWVNLGVMKTENCYHYLKSHLFDLIDIRSENICFFNGEADDLKYQCALTDEFIKSNCGIDMMLLGVGMNGHIGLNEPGTSFDKYSHVVELDEVTKKIAQKYFSAVINLSQGITLGMQHVMETKTVFLQISGRKKSLIVKRLLETGLNTDFPASLIKQHPNSTLLLDSDASQIS